jgi:hypothetical protein
VGDVLDDQAKALADGINKKAGARVIAAVHLDVTRAADWRARGGNMRARIRWPRHPGQQRRYRADGRGR